MEKRTLRQERARTREQPRDTRPSGGRYELSVRMPIAKRVTRGWLERVALVERKDHRCVGRRKEPGSLLKWRRRAQHPVGDVDDDVRIPQGPLRGVAHSVLKRVFGIEQSRR